MSSHQLAEKQQAHRTRRDNVPAGCPLTNRQYEVMTFFAQGVTGKQIARKLGIKYTTVQSHAHNAYDALGLSGMGGKGPAIVMMKDSGWIGAMPRPGSRLTAIQHVYCVLWDRATSTRTPRDVALLDVAGDLLLGEHRLNPDRPHARPDIDTLLLRMALALTRPIAPDAAERTAALAA